jgi:hypothetical protein
VFQTAPKSFHFKCQHNNTHADISLPFSFATPKPPFFYFIYLLLLSFQSHSQTIGMSSVVFEKTFGEIYLETCRSGGLLSPTAIQLLLKSIFVFGKDCEPFFPYDVPPPPEEDVDGSSMLQEDVDVVGFVPDDFAMIGSGLCLHRLNLQEIDFPQLLACFPKCSGALRISLFECTMRLSDMELLYDTVSGLQNVRFLLLDGVKIVPDEEGETGERDVIGKKNEALARFCSIPVAHLSLRVCLSYNIPPFLS